MYIGPHTCMSGYVSAYHGVGKLCILLHTILCHAVKDTQPGPEMPWHWNEQDGCFSMVYIVCNSIDLWEM